MSKHIMKGVYIFGLFFAISACIADEGNSESPVKVTGTYSDLCFNAESGDVLGLEIAISMVGEEYVAVFQAGEGVPRKPVVEKVDFLGDGKIVIHVKEDNGYEGELKAEVSEAGLTGMFLSGQLSPRGDETFTLIRQASFWSSEPHRKCEWPE